MSEARASGCSRAGKVIGRRGRRCSSMKWSASRMSSQAGKGFGMFEVASRLQQTGADIIHLEVGRPSSDTPIHIKEAAKAALDAGIVHYGELQGLQPLRVALAERYTSLYGANYSPDEVLITNGVTQASFATFMAAIEEGDEVIVLDPFYPQHNSKIRLAGGIVVTVPLKLMEGTFRLDIDAVETAISPATKMIVLVNPANPTGTVYTREELQQLAAVAVDNDLLVLSDEVYEFITFDEHRHVCFASLPGMKERTITVSAFTKAYAMDGWRMGFAAAPEPIIAELRRVTMNSTTHPCVFAQEGALVAVTASQDCVKQMVAEDRVRRDLVVETINAIPGMNCPVPQGTIYAFCDISGLGVDADTLALRVLEETHVAVESGVFYSGRGKDYLRICFGSEPYERLAEGMKRLSSYLAKEAT
jgi:aspartate aminotransferase